MKTTSFGAAVLLAALASAGGAAAETRQPVDDEAGRAAQEARAVLATLAGNAHLAHEALAAARALGTHGRDDQVRCTNEALSRADVALRGARDDVAQMTAQYAARQLREAHAALARLRLRETWSRQAAVASRACTAPLLERTEDGTTVTVIIDPSLPPLDPTFPKSASDRGGA